MHIVSRPAASAGTRRFSLSSAVAIATIAALGTSVQAAPVAQRPTLRIETPPVQDSGRRPLTFTPFSSPLIGTTAQDLTVGPDGNLWLTTYVGNPGMIVRMTPKGVSTAFTYPVGSSGSLSLSITPGPDGALWFVDYFADLIGKVTTKGVVTTYPLPTQQGCGGFNQDPDHPLGITAGPDGAMWFTLSQRFGGNMSCPPGQNPEIGRITTTGQMNFYTMPDSGPVPIFPYRITSGPDGALWFTTNINVQGAVELGVGSITTGGVITVSSGFPGTSPQDAGDYLTFSSKKLYVADTNDQAVIRVSGYAPAATYPIPGIGSSYPYGPYGITPDSHGRLWFTTHTDGGYEQLGEMTPGGQFTMYQVPQSLGTGCCGSLAFRETHQLWFPYTPGSAGVNVIEATNVP